MRQLYTDLGVGRSSTILKPISKSSISLDYFRSGGMMEENWGRSQVFVQIFIPVGCIEAKRLGSFFFLLEAVSEVKRDSAPLAALTRK
jgi:hypothetical protein